MIERVTIASIRIGERRRQDYGDIAALAKNIDQHGLIHPIVISDDNELIVGGRRLQACVKLGWADIDARRWRVLDEAERREIELAENLDRKDLTAIERSRQMVALAETAAEVLARSAKTHPATNGGRPPKAAVAEEALAERLGVPRRTLNEATRHVSAVDTYPELAVHTQTDALKIAAKLDAMPEPERVETRAAVMAHDGEMLARLTDRPPMPKGPTPQERATNDPGVRFQSDLSTFWKRVNGVRDYGGISAVLAKLTDAEKRDVLADVERISEVVGQWQIVIREQIA